MSVNKLLVQILPWYASREQNFNFLSILNLKVFFLLHAPFKKTLLSSS